MHYEGPNGTGYGYEIRTAGQSSSNPPEVEAEAA